VDWIQLTVDHIQWRAFENTMKMEVTALSETSVNFYESAFRNIPKDDNIFSHWSENLTTHKFPSI
jgi:hypothetical protein